MQRNWAWIWIKFRQDLLSRRVEDRILLDVEGGAPSGVNGTPTFFVNGFRGQLPLAVGRVAGAAGRAAALK